MASVHYAKKKFQTSVPKNALSAGERQLVTHEESPTGAQFELATTLHGRTQRAVINETGASLRALEIDGVALVQDYPVGTATPMSAGAVLVPWPNRIAAATWDLHGMAQHLPVTEPARGHAIHGLLREVRYVVEEHTEYRLVLSATIQAREGYPFDLATRVEYELGLAGLSVRHIIENIGAGNAPVAVGAHPYLCVGDVPVRELVLRVNANAHLELDALMIPTGVVTDVEGTELDYRGGRVVDSVSLDDAWTDLVPEADGGSVHGLDAPDGSGVELRMDAAFGFIQVYTTDAFPGLGGPISAVAMEPMTAPANGFNTGGGLRWLAPGEQWNIGWGIGYRPAAG